VMLLWLLVQISTNGGSEVDAWPCILACACCVLVRAEGGAHNDDGDEDDSGHGRSEEKKCRKHGFKMKDRSGGRGRKGS